MQTPEDVHCVMVKLPLVSLHPAGVPLPVNVHVPVATALESEVPFPSIPFSIPVTFPFRVRVLLPDCTVNAIVPVTWKVV